MFKKIILENEIICTGGIDHLDIYPNGNISRCSSSQEIFTTIKEYNENHDKITKNFLLNPFCKKIKCHEQCEGAAIEVWHNGEKIFNNSYFWRSKISNISEIDTNNINCYLTLNGECVNNCPYCITKKFGMLTNQKEISKNCQINTDDIINLIDILSKKSGIKKITITGGGDPVLHDNFEKIIDKCSDNGFEIILFGSGLVYQDKYFNIRNKNKIVLTISLHPLSKNWDKQKIINFITKAKQEYKYVMASFVSEKNNMKHYEETKDLCDSLGIHFHLNEYFEPIF